jgi:membrane associated rhomboid family serine protease
LIPFSDSPKLHSGIPYLTISIILITTAVFALQVIGSKFAIIFQGSNVAMQIFFLKWGFIPYEILSGIDYKTLINPGDIDSGLPLHAGLVTSLFVHGSGSHYVLNMLFLWVFGDNVEHRLGKLSFSVLYISTGIIGNLLHYWFNKESNTPLIGASGAIAGVMGAYIILFPRNKVRILFMFILITVAEIKAIYILGIWFIWQLVQALLQFGVPSVAKIAFLAHVGGFLSGMALVAIFIFGSTRQRKTKRN